MIIFSFYIKENIQVRTVAEGHHCAILDIIIMQSADTLKN